MKANIECYLRYEVGEPREFRCFLPINLEDSYCNTVSANVIRRSLHAVQMANAVVDLTNAQVIKDRYQETEYEITVEDIPSLRDVPLSEYSELQEFVEFIRKPPAVETITEFKGEYHFLSNFHAAPFVYQDVEWPHSEAAYQAMKTTCTLWPVFAAMTNPVDAKRAGKTVDMRSDWNSVKVGLMREIVREKFIQNPHLRA